MNNAYKRPFSPSFSEIYNPNWQNRPNFSWRNDPNANEPHRYSSNPQYAPPQVKKTLKETLQAFMEGQTQINKNTVDNYHELKNNYQEPKIFMGRIESHLSTREQGTFLAQPQPNPILQGQAKTVNEYDGQIRQVQVVTTLRSG